MRHLFLAPLILFAAAAPSAEKPNKNAAWPPKAGIKTPGIQVPFANLKAEAEFPLEAAPSGLLLDGVNLIVAVKDKNSLVRIDTKLNKALEAWKDVPAPCGGMLNTFGGLWTANCGKGTLSRIDSKKGTVAQTVELGVGSASTALAANADSLWVLSDDKTTLTRLDAKEGAVVSELRLPAACNGIAFAADALWVTCPAQNRVLRIDPKTNLVDKRIETAIEPVAMAYGESHLWVLGAKEGKISKIDPKTNKAVTTIETGIPAAAMSMAFGDGHVWVSAAGYPLTKINAQTDKVVQQFAGEGGGMLRFAANALWLVNPAKLTLSRIDPKRVAATLPE
jgi:virginiamycin B lyase